MIDKEEIDYTYSENKQEKTLEQKVKEIIKHLKKNECVATYDKNYYIAKLEDLL